MLACAIALSFTAHIFAVFPFDLKISHELQEEKNPVFAFRYAGGKCNRGHLDRNCNGRGSFGFFIVPGANCQKLVLSLPP